MHKELSLASALGNVVKAGLGATQMSGIQGILEAIAKELRACGCVLWEATPSSHPEPPYAPGAFFALAQWFESGDIWGQSNLTVDSATGHAVANNLRTYVVDDIRTDSHCHKAPFLLEHKMTRACVVPLVFADKARGCINVFRMSDSPAFSELDAELVVQMTELVPPLYETVRDEVAYRCSRSLNHQLHSATLSGRVSSAFQGVLREVCTELATNLNCLDVSVYLQPAIDSPVYELSATTLPKGVARSEYRRGDDGPGAFPLADGRPLRVLDLCDPNTYPAGVGPAQPAYIQHLLAHPRYKKGSPLSFIAVPVVVGERILGVMRCCAPTSPTYFASREMDLLTLLAGQIGHVVSDKQNQLEKDREYEAYKVLVEGATSLTRLVYDEMKASKPDEDRVLQNCLRAIANAIPGDHWLGVGVCTKGQEYAGRSFAPSQELPWSQLDHFTIPAAWERRFESDVLIASPDGAWPFSATDGAIPAGESASLLLCRISCLSETWLLEIASLGRTSLPKHSRAIARLLGTQLGLYHDLLTTISTLKETQAQLVARIAEKEVAAKAQAQAMMDLEHQIRAPLRHARMRIPLLLRLAGAMSDTQLTKQLQYLRGTLRRAGRVAGNSRLFSLLATGHQIECSPTLVSFDDIKLLLIEAAMDNQLIADESKGMTFGVEKESFEKLSGKVKVDRDLFDQAINDLLDNAAKYGDERSHVRIEGSVSKAYFIVSVISKGLRIGAEQTQTLKQRGERGAVARLAAGEGSGIGLWIADEIMKAHQGILEIVPTTPDRITRIRLMFPIQRP